MSILFEVLEKFKDYAGKAKVKTDQINAEVSLFENIINSYESILNSKQRSENQNYLTIIERLKHSKNKIDDKNSIVGELERKIVKFQERYQNIKKEAELQAISQKAFIRIKENEFNDYLIKFNLKSREAQDLKEKKDGIESDVSYLKNEIEEKCKEYINRVRTFNFEELKTDVDMHSSLFFEKELQDMEDGPDYLKSEEYLNSTIEYKEAYNRLNLFIKNVFTSVKKFTHNISLEQILPELLNIQNALREKYIISDEIEMHLKELNDFINTRDSIEQNLEAEKKELSEIIQSTEINEELLSLKREIEDFIVKND